MKPHSKEEAKGNVLYAKIKSDLIVAHVLNVDITI